MTAGGDLLDRPDVVDAVEQARAALASLRRHPGLRRAAARAGATARARAARASAALDGAPPGHPNRGPAAGPAEVQPLLGGALRVASELPKLESVWPRAPLQALARLHALAAADLVGADLLGRPQPRDDLSARLVALAGLVSTRPAQDAPSPVRHSPFVRWPVPIRCAVVHGEIAAWHPFGSADGIVARAAARLEMVTGGLDPDGTSVPEMAFLAAGPRYRELLDGYQYSGDDGLAAWVIFVCAGMVAGAREGASIVAEVVAARP